MNSLSLIACLLAITRVCGGGDGVDNNTSTQSQDFFINELFDKYGDSGVMSFEGFEHLLESLGLGQLEFDKDHSVALHRVNGTFKEVHDDLQLHHHEHNSTVRRRRGLSHSHSENHPPEETGAKQVSCMSPQAMLSTFGLKPGHGVLINLRGFEALCPALVYELDQRACYPEPQTSTTTRHASAWWSASLSVLVISLVGLLGVAVVPLVHKTFFKPCLQFLVALAVGTLLGDALLHLLPHAMQHDHRTSALRSAVAFFAVALFYVVESGVRTLSSNPAESSSRNKTSNQDADDEEGVEMNAMLGKGGEGHTHDHGGVGSVAWMVIMGDGLHNLTDGLAIGAAFTSGTVAGLATTLAVFCHELPHEIGDFAVLLGAGMSVRKALMYNVFSSILSFIGMAAGVWLGKYEDAAPWIYSFTAGTFLYISLVDLVPQLATSATSMGCLMAQLAGVMSGGGIMLIIALYEDSLTDMFHTWIE